MGRPSARFPASAFGIVALGLLLVLAAFIVEGGPDPIAASEDREVAGEAPRPTVASRLEFDEESSGPPTQTWIQGVVLDREGTPVAQAGVWLRGGKKELPGSQDAHRAGAQTRTDEEGRFRVGAPTDARYVCFASHPMKGFGFRGPIDAKGPVRDLGPIHLEPFASVVGRLVASDGAPLPHLLVRLLPLPHDPVLGVPGRPFESFAATTAPEGTFEIANLFTGRAALLVEADPFATELVAVRLEPGVVSDVGTLVLSPGRKIRGLVLDERGHPVPGLRAQLRWRETEEITWRTRTLPPSGRPPVLTGTDGTFEIGGVPRGGVGSVQVGHGPVQLEEKLPADDSPIVLRAYVYRTSVRLDLRETGSGEPLDPAWWSFASQWTTGSPGWHREEIPNALLGAPARLEPGRYRLRFSGLFLAVRVSAWSFGHEVGTATIPRPDGPVEEDVESVFEIALPESACSIEVLVRDSTGSPIPGSLVVVHHRPIPVSGFERSKTTDSAGLARFTGLPPGRFFVGVYHAGTIGLPEWVEVEDLRDPPGRERVEVTVPAPARVRGVLRVGWNPPRDTWIVAARLAPFPDSLESIFAPVDREGNFEFPRLPPKEWTFAPRLAAHPEASLRPDTWNLPQVRSNLSPGAEEFVEIDVPADGVPGTILGTLFANDAPGRGFTVSVLPPVEKYPSAEDVTGADGRFRGLVPKGPRERRLRVRKETGTLWERVVESVAGETTRVEIRLALGAVTGTIRGSPDLAEPRSVVTLLPVGAAGPAAGGSLRAWTDARGGFRFEEVPAGLWRLARREHGQFGRPFQVAAGQTVEAPSPAEGACAPVVLRAEGTSPGRTYLAAWVVDADGVPVSPGPLPLMEETKMVLPHGRYRVTTRDDAGRDRVLAEFVVPDDAEVVVPASPRAPGR